MLTAMIAVGVYGAEALRSVRFASARLLVAARLLAPDGEEPPPAARAVLAGACGCDDWAGTMAGLDGARRTVAAAWQAVFGERCG